MLEYLTLGEFVVAMLMSLAALCAFVWGAATGAFQGVEAIKHQVLEVEGLCEPEDVAGPQGELQGRPGAGAPRLEASNTNRPRRPRRAYE